MEEEINSKNITPEVIGGDDYYDLDELSPENIPEEEYQEEQPVDPNAENALIDVIDVGLDFAEDLLKDWGYPPLKRKIWEQHGRAALNKALNAYFPPGAGNSTGINQPIVCLVIGLGALGICLYPAIAYKIKKSKEKAQQEQLVEQTEETQEEPAPTNEVSEHILTVSERVSQMEEQVV